MQRYENFFVRITKQKNDNPKIDNFNALEKFTNKKEIYFIIEVNLFNFCRTNRGNVSSTHAFTVLNGPKVSLLYTVL